MTIPFPQLETERLILRQTRRTDAPTLVQLLQDREIANNVLTIPHPYTHEDALSFLARMEEQPAEQNPAFVFALTRREDGAFLGVCGLHTNDNHNRAEVGYWLGKDYRGQNYTTEAVRRVIQFGFEELGLNRIYAECFLFNIGSARVMEKSGMTREGLLRQLVRHKLSGEYRDVYLYSILWSEYEARLHER